MQTNTQQANELLSEKLIIEGKMEKIHVSNKEKDAYSSLFLSANIHESNGFQLLNQQPCAPPCS